MPAEHRLPPHPAPRDQRGRHDGIDQPVGGAGGARGVVGAPHLAQHLGLTQDLGVEPGGHVEQVANRLLAVEAQQGLAEARAAAQGEIPEPRLEVEVAGPVDLAAIAGREEKRGAAGSGLALKPGRDFRRS